MGVIPYCNGQNHMSKGGCLLMYNPFSLEGKTILITGASSGMGRATAIECSKLGARCIITARNKERLQETFGTLEGSNHVQILTDLTKDDERNKLIDSIPILDGLVCNAGMIHTKVIPFINQADFNSVFSINTFAPVLLIKDFYKKKKINKGGSVVVMSSLASMKEDYGNAVYGMSKAAIESFTRYCALEFSNRRIRVNSIHPSMVNTESIQKLSFSQESLKKDENRYPLKRYGEPQDIAWAIIYLLSDASSWVTGTNFVIDGGAHLI